MNNETANVASHLNFNGALEHAAKGASLKDIASILGCSVRIMMAILKKDPIFKRDLAQAREIGFTARAEELREIVADNVWGDANHLRVMVDTEKWILSKLHPAVFGDRIAVQVETVDISGAMKEAKERTLKVINPENVAIDIAVKQITNDPFAGLYHKM